MEWPWVAVLSPRSDVEGALVPVNGIDSPGDCPAFPDSHYLGLLHGVEDCQLLCAGPSIRRPWLCLQPFQGEDQQVALSCTVQVKLDEGKAITSHFARFLIRSGFQKGLMA